jgi:hypothetical protein
MQNLKRIDFFCNKLEFVSSQLFKPIMNNVLTCVNFINNTKIDAIYGPGLSKTSLDNLMRIIDEKCKKPIVVNSRVELIEDLARGFENLWISGRLSDFVIKVGSKEFPVHRMVLSVHSSVFAEIFEKDEQSKEMIIEDLSAEVVEDFLRFLYTSKVSENVNAMDLFAIAAKLNVQRLKLISENLIIKSLDQENAQKVFNLAHVYKSEKLKKSAFKEITKMFPNVTLPGRLIEDPEAVKELITLKLKTDSILKKF